MAFDSRHVSMEDLLLSSQYSPDASPVIRAAEPYSPDVGSISDNANSNPWDDRRHSNITPALSRTASSVPSFTHPSQISPNNTSDSMSLSDEQFAQHEGPSNSDTTSRFQAMEPSSRTLTPFSPSTEGRFSIESTETAKGLTDWNIDGGGQRVGYENLTAIDWIHEYAKARQRDQVFTHQLGLRGQFNLLFDSSQVWLILIATGLSVGVIAAMIDVVSNWLGDIKLGYCKSAFYLSEQFCCWGEDDNATCDDWLPWGVALHASGAGGYIVGYIFYIIYGVLFGTVASFLVLQYAPYASHSGIPEIKTVLGGFIIKEFMGKWTLFTKSIGLCLASASGLWLGKEGPLVHVACCCSNFFVRLTAIRRNEAIKREIFSAAAAAGITVAFGAPVGGVLFSLEQVSYYFPDKTLWQSFVCAMVASVSIQLLNPFRTGKLVLFQVIYSRPFHKFELLPFVLIGVVGGLFGALFIKLNMKIARWRSTNRIMGYPLFEVFLVSVATSIINFPDVFSRLQNNILVFHLFQECDQSTSYLCNLDHYGSTIVQLLLTCVIGLIFTAYTFGTSVPSGVLMPSMAIGACYGRIVGIIMEVWQQNSPEFFLFDTCLPDLPCITPGVYAIVGAASAIGGVTRLTVSLVVIMFELTGALTYVLPIMIAVMVSKWVGDAVEKRGIYESWIDFHGYPYLDHTEETIPDINVSEIMTPVSGLVVLTTAGHSVAELEQLLETKNYKGYPVVVDTRNDVLVGYISRSELRYALHQAKSTPGLSENSICYLGGPIPTEGDAAVCVDLRQWVDQTPITLSTRSNLQLAVGMFQKLGLRYILLTKRGRLCGLLTKKDVCARFAEIQW
ncbi:chloride channel [Lipomyces arxii]|uniref:chloride channel n=1 Tax=Lipomyces arxii TaxID=56418 RepID=UPI0034CF8B6D